MSSSSPRRVGALVGPVLVGAFFLASCGATDDAATRSTIDLSADSTAFVVRPPATTEPPADTAGEDGVVTTEQEYVVQSGDTPIGVANAFGVSLDELVAYNEWSSAALPFPGETIKIPPGGTAPGAQAATESTSTETDEAAPAETIPDAGDNCSQGEYTVADGDYEGKVAANFDVTVDALRAANSSTPNYSSFYPGLVIVIPAKSDC